MRPFKQINDEVEVGYSADFERRWRYAELFGRAVMFAVVLAALLGLLGRGPYSHHSTMTPESGLLVDYEPVARFGNETMITLHARPETCVGGMDLWLDSKFIEPMGLQSMMPRPVLATPLPDGMRLHYDLDPDLCRATVVRLFAKPSAIGFVPLKLRLNQRPALSWKIFLVP